MGQPVKLNRTIALLMLLANVVFIIITVIWFFYLRPRMERVASTNSYAASAAYNASFQSGLTFFNVVVLSGMLWLQITFKEKRWLWSGIIANFVARLLFVILAIAMRLLSATMEWDYYQLVKSIGVLSTAVTFYTAFTCFFVRSKTIQLQFIVFGLIMLLTSGLPFIAPYLYDKFGQHWMLDNIYILMMAPLLVTLWLYIKIYCIARKQKRDETEVLPARNVPFNFDQHV